MKTILDYIVAEEKKEHKQTGHFVDGVKYVFDLAEKNWLPALKYDAEEIANFVSEAADIISWAEHGTIPTPEQKDVFDAGLRYGADKIPEILGYKILYVIEGATGTDLEGMTFAICTSNESAYRAYKASFDGEDVQITPIIADAIILDGKIVKTND